MQNSFSEEQKKRISAKITEKLAEKVYASQNEAASLLGISSAALSQLLAGNWESIGDKAWAKLAAQLLPANDWLVCEDTENFRRFTNACADAHKNKLFTAICAHTGAGKTTALKAFQNKKAGVYYVWCDGMFTRTLLIQKIARAMGIEIAGVTANELNDQIVQKLTDPSASRTLILDSVHKLEGKGTIEYVGGLAEAIEHRAGLIIAGTEQLRQKIDLGVTKSKAGYSELKRRVYNWTSANDERAIFLKDARQIIARNGIVEPKTITELLTNEVNNFGVLRNRTNQRQRIIAQQSTK